jgi:hypothetical protein
MVNIFGGIAVDIAVTGVAALLSYAILKWAYYDWYISAPWVLRSSITMAPKTPKVYRASVSILENSNLPRLHKFLAVHLPDGRWIAAGVGGTLFDPLVLDHWIEINNFDAQVSAVDNVDVNYVIREIMKTQGDYQTTS